MRSGRMHKFGEIILAEVQYTDTFEVKTRPALVLFKEYDNVVVAGITSNPHMKGIALTKKDGAVANSVIKLNYIFTISENMIKKYLFHLSREKAEQVKKEVISKFS